MGVWPGRWVWTWPFFKLSFYGPLMNSNLSLLGFFPVCVLRTRKTPARVGDLPIEGGRRGRERKRKPSDSRFLLLEEVRVLANAGPRLNVVF